MWEAGLLARRNVDGPRWTSFYLDSHTLGQPELEWNTTRTICWWRPLQHSSIVGYFINKCSKRTLTVAKDHRTNDQKDNKNRTVILGQQYKVKKGSNYVEQLQHKSPIYQKHINDPLTVNQSFTNILQYRGKK